MKFLRPPPISTSKPLANGVSTSCRAMSMQPCSRAVAESSASFSQLRSAEWVKVAPGVAWVARAVVTTPAAMSLAEASSHRVSIGAARAPAQSLRLALWPMLSTPARVFTPVAIALMVPAESGVCESVL